MSACDTCVVRNTAICSGLDSTEIAALSNIGRRRWLEAGESLVWEGDQSVLVANVIEGMLKLSTGTADGREQIVGVVTDHSITALTAAHVCVFARADFDRFAGEHPALEHKLLQRTLAELDRTRKWMLLLSRKNAEEKVATFLLEMSERLAISDCDSGGQPVPLDAFDLPFSRQQTAMGRGGVIALPSRRAVEIRDRAALEAMAG
jgi:CRP/FNR family transcriptional regulator